MGERLNLKGAIEQVIRSVIEHRDDVFRFGFRRVVVANPVASHESMASWRPSAGAPSEYMEPTGGTHQVPGDEVVDVVVGAAGPEQNLYMTNNKPYENRLAHGWSQQQEEGWIERELEAGAAEARANFKAGRLSI